MADKVIAKYTERRRMEKLIMQHSDLVDGDPDGPHSRRLQPGWSLIRIAAEVNGAFHYTHARAVANALGITFVQGKAKAIGGEVTREEFDIFTRAISKRLDALEAEVFEV